MNKTLIKNTFFFLFVAACLGGLVNLFSPRAIASIGDWDKSKGVVTPGGKNDAVVHRREIELPEAQALFKQGVLFVDARPKELYDEGRIQGAVLLSFDDVWNTIGKFEKQYPSETPMVLYCSGRECPDSHELAKILVDLGYSSVKVFSDGFPLWRDQLLPVEP